MRILHPTDFSKTAAKALALARALRLRTGGELHLTHVQQRFQSGLNRPFVQPQLDSVNPEIAKRLQEDQQAEVDRLRSMLQHLASPDGTIELRWGETLRELLDMAPDYDLIVMGAHGMHRLDDVFLGGIANRMVRRSPVPVITVRQECTVTQVQRVLVGTDFSDAAKEAMRFALGLRQYGVKVVLVHVIDDVRVQDDPTLVRRITTDLEREAADGVERHVLREGDPMRVLPSVADEVGADLIAIGVRRHERGLGVLLGRRADGLMRTSAIPILSVPGRQA